MQFFFLTIANFDVQTIVGVVKDAKLGHQVHVVLGKVHLNRDQKFYTKAILQKRDLTRVFFLSLPESRWRSGQGHPDLRGCWASSKTGPR